MKRAAFRRLDKHQRNENSFTSKLDNLFNTTHANALQMNKMEEDKKFVKAQREKGRRGSLGSVDIKLSRLEARRQKEKEKEEKR